MKHEIINFSLLTLSSYSRTASSSFSDQRRLTRGLKVSSTQSRVVRSISGEMDLVSSTLDKYLRHRFNGTVLPPSQPQPQPQPQPPPPPPQSQHQQSTTSDPATLPTNAETQDSSTIDASKQDEAEENMGTDSRQAGELITNMHYMANDTNSDICEPIEIHSLSFQKIMPCCVAIHHNLSYIAAGFENSQIYLWSVIHDKSDDSLDKNQQINSQDRVSDNSSGPSQDTKQLEEGTASTGDAQPEPCQSKRELRLGEMFRLLAHSGSVYSIEFIQDNDLILSCSEDTTIRLWCLKSKCNLIVYRGHNYPIWSITISPRGDYFASASMDTTARLWSFDKMCPLRIFCGHEDDVECLKFHPNSRYLATGSSDSTVRLWTISDGRMVRLMVGHRSPITSLSFFPDGKFLASASSDGTIKVWNLATNSVKNELTAPAICSVAFSPSQEFASTCGKDNILRIWHVDDSSIAQKRTLDFRDKYSKMIQSLFLRDDELFVVGFARKNATKPRDTTSDTPMIH